MPARLNRISAGALGGSVGHDGQLVPVFPGFGDANGLDAFDLTERPGNGLFASGALDTLHVGSVGDFGSEGGRGENETDEDEDDEERFHFLEQWLMQDLCIKFLHSYCIMAEETLKRKPIANGNPREKMKYLATIFFIPALLSCPLGAQETGDEIFEYNVGERNYFTGEGVNVGGFLFPSLFVQGAGGVFEPGAGAGDFSTTEHDPQNDWGISDIHLHLDFDFGGVVTGTVTGFGHQAEDHVWEAEFEEAFLHWRINDTLSLGGGQFRNAFGFQSDLHPHDWSFVNQNLINTRMVNEGEFISQGGEILVRTPSSGLLTFGLGGIRSHAHDHGHGDEHGHEEEGHDDHEEEEKHEEEDHHDEHDDHDEHGGEHLEIDDAGFKSWALTTDYRFRMPFDDSLTGSVSLGVGENGFGRNSTVYGLGLRKVWNGHDHGFGGPDFCAGATMWQGEVIGRNVDAFLEDGDEVTFSDYGFSNSLHHGLSDRITASLRHDWVSDVEIAELNDRHRLSAALTAFVDPAQRVRARLQYDYTIDDTIGSEHVAWFQIQLQWGGIGGSHAGHGH
jgi:hypothetical protein